MKQYRVPEIMDSSTISPGSHYRALAGLESINRWSHSASIVWREIEPLVEPGKSLRILDVATGAGDVPIALWRRAQAYNVRMEIDACDKSSTALEYARHKAQQHSASIRFFPCDILTQPVVQSYDIVVSSLFLHHLDAATAALVLHRLSTITRKRLIINDLRRSNTGWILAFGAGCVLRSRVVCVDGPRSVRAAYTIREVIELAARAGLPAAQVEPRFPFRFIMTWSRT